CAIPEKGRGRRKGRLRTPSIQFIVTIRALPERQKRYASWPGADGARAQPSTGRPSCDRLPTLLTRPVSKRMRHRVRSDRERSPPPGSCRRCSTTRKPQEERKLMWHKHIRLGLILSACAAALSPFSAEAAFDGFTPEAVSATAGADSADGRRAALPSIKAHRLNGGGDIRLDGKLDDTAWRDAEPARGFRVWDPDRGALPSEETVFKVVYDEGAVYFGVACLERDPSKITAKLSRRDRDSKSDLVSIYIDPYLDRTTGYNFRVNPLGVQLDSYIYNDGDRDDDWDAVWEAETFRDQNGWYAEIRIPFSAIRYRTAP